MGTQMSLKTVRDQYPLLMPDAIPEQILYDGLRDRPLVYVAAYYTANPAHGMAEAMRAWTELVDLGYLPYVPHTSFLLDVVHPHSPEFWYEYDLGILKRCDMLYICDDERTDESSGVSLEIAYAHGRGIPIFYGLTHLLTWELDQR